MTGNEAIGATARDRAFGATARDRAVAAARSLFVTAGYRATSLQQIADTLGVTKAAVYHVFPSKAEILRAVLAPAAERMAEVAAQADAAQSPAQAFEIALAGLVDLVMDHGDIASMLRRDASVAELVAHDTEFIAVTDRLDRALIGASPSDEARAALVFVGGGLATIGADASFRGVDRPSLRRVLEASVRSVLERYRS
jgi:AcrR family transcriptional regulator